MNTTVSPSNLSEKKSHTKLIIFIISLVVVLAVVSVILLLYFHRPVEPVNENTGNLIGITCSNNEIGLQATSIKTDGNIICIDIKVTGILSGNGIPTLSGIRLTDKNNNEYTLSSWGTGTKNENAGFDKTQIIFQGNPDEPTELKLTVNCINGVSGKWELNIPLTAGEEDTNYTCSVDYSFPNGTAFTVTRVTIYKAYAVFNGNFSNYNDKNSKYNSAKLFINGSERTGITYGSDGKTFHLETPVFDPDDKIELQFTIGEDLETQTVKKEIRLVK